MGDSHETAERARPAASTETLVDALKKSGSDFELLAHPRTFSATEEAHALGVKEQIVAKTLVVRDEGGHHIRAVVPASHRLNLEKLARAVDVHKLTLLGEPELQQSYPQFALGAVPPFSGPAGDVVVVDKRLTECEQVVFEAGVHDTSVRLRIEDLLTVAGALVADIASG